MEREMMASRKKASVIVILQVIGTDTVDTTPSILISTDNQRYLFNCGEGTQRLFNENKLKLVKLNNIFCTQISWDCIGGLPGLAMTLRDNGKPNLGLYGPKNIKDFIKATRFFLSHEKVQFNLVGYASDENQVPYNDENVTICPVLLSEDKKVNRQSEEQIENSPKRVKLDYCTSKVIACYICKLATLPGKFILQKAKDLSVPEGPLFGKLKLGQDVTLDNGVKILAEEVKEPDQIGPVFLIIDCPSTKYISSLVESEQFVEYQETEQLQPCIIVHLVPMEVFNHCLYEKWRQRFGSKTQHLLINKQACSKAMVFQSQARIQTKLHTIDPVMFPLLYYSDKPATDPRTLPANTQPGELFLKFQLGPIKQQGYDRSGMQKPLDFQTIMKETIALLKNVTRTEHHSATSGKTTANNEEDVSPINTSLSEVGTHSLEICDKAVVESTTGNISDILCEENRQETEVNSLFDNPADSDQLVVSDYEKKKDFEIVFLGTGASLPSKYRNVSATLIHISAQSSVLLDCGEGTLGQLYRHYGNEMDDVIERLKCVFISHMHADHHLGLLRILLSKNNHKGFDRNDDDIIVIGPDRINLWLQEYSMHCEELHYRFIDCEEIVEGDHDFTPVFDNIEAHQVLAVPVEHCPQAYGLVLQHASGWKLVYSGDTRPCSSLIQAGINATVLIHEATFEDVLQNKAIDKKHSTTKEAINSGIEMNASFTMLNHFSQRYPKIPVFNEKFTKHTGIAFDHMKVKLADLYKIPRLLNPLKVLFANEVEEMSKRTNTTASCPGENTTVRLDEKPAKD